METCIPQVAPLDPNWFDRAERYQNTLTMPTGALGRLLAIARHLCAVQETLHPRAEPAAIVVMAADHGIAEENVSAYPQQVTSQMVANFLRGGAAINVLARRQRARVLVVDMGIKHPDVLGSFANSPDFVSESLSRSTANFAKGPAMTVEQVREALATGRRVVAEKLPQTRILVLGEMGIGNTTSASALTALLTCRPTAEVTGRGTGLDDAGWRHKVAVIERALLYHFPQSGVHVDPVAALAAVGGFEIAGMVGAALEAASRRMLVVLDGLISSTAGLLAARLQPSARDYFLAAHKGVEIGHAVILRELGLEPIFDLDLRLGEGSGGALALNLVQCAADIMKDMATFETARVANADSEPERSDVS